MMHSAHYPKFIQPWILSVFQNAFWLQIDFDSESNLAWLLNAFRQGLWVHFGMSCDWIVTWIPECIRLWMSECSLRCILRTARPKFWVHSGMTADRPRFWEQPGMASYCILAGTMSAIWYVLWLQFGMSCDRTVTWIPECIRPWISECIPRCILSAARPTFWMHSGMASDCTLLGPWCMLACLVIEL